ncbi:MAG: GH92 family glycosyl hydrolase [Candidatus Marinimicrobia bacterium]|nr:GH92 family glycosyl hydrolase [Candidatus Neomarinimicrobiota bacterium]MCF7850945.1 GH92 family glycosyl hydrolase [Candidatus Neomarinimicrobiota bacterium]
MLKGILLSAALVIVSSCSIFKYTDSGSLTEYVDPLIGTAGGGNTFPGAVYPWGMISLSPHTALGSPSGYLHGEPYFYGLGHSHLSGTGCADLGGVILTVIDDETQMAPENYRTRYANETAQPGYYSVRLPERNVKLETTVTQRAGLIRITALKAGTYHILVDVGRSLALTGGGAIDISDSSVIRGRNISGGFCGEENRQSLYFYMDHDHTPSAKHTWINDQPSDSLTLEQSDTSLGAIISFNMKAQESVVFRTGISYVNQENARLNSLTEIPDPQFDLVRLQSSQVWDEVLGRITVRGAEQSDLIKFYSALYHMLIHPNLVSDVNGEFLEMGSKAVGQYTDRSRYSIFSLWDTYRTLHPFLNLVYPDKQREMALTMLDMYTESGFLPKWELTGLETYMMVGDPATPVIVESYLKGVLDEELGPQILEAVLAPALPNGGRPAPPIRAGYHEMLEYGYIPAEQDWSTDWWVWGPVSTTLEYCYADHAIARLADQLGNPELAGLYRDRSKFYKNLFDPEMQFLRPRSRSGDWATPFDPLATEGAGDWEGSGGPGYVEGNAWNYTWFVPHDISGLAQVFGSEEKMLRKLDESFSNNQFTINNEPDIGYPFIYSYFQGNERKTSARVSQIMEEDYGLGPSGLPGNDDCGTISAWFAFAALGLYPVDPVSSEYVLFEPLFKDVQITIPPLGSSSESSKIRRIGSSSGESDHFLDGEKLSKPFVSHIDLVGSSILTTR